MSQQLGELHVVEASIICAQLGPVGKTVPEEIVSEHAESGCTQILDRVVPGHIGCSIAMNQHNMLTCRVAPQLVVGDTCRELHEASGQFLLVSAVRSSLLVPITLTTSSHLSNIGRAIGSICGLYVRPVVQRTHPLIIRLANISEKEAKEASGQRSSCLSGARGWLGRQSAPIRSDIAGVPGSGSGRAIRSGRRLRLALARY